MTVKGGYFLWAIICQIRIQNLSQMLQYKTGDFNHNQYGVQQQQLLNIAVNSREMKNVGHKRHRIVQAMMHQKYGMPKRIERDCALLHVHLINKIINPDKGLTPQRIFFQEIQLLCRPKECIKRFYSFHEAELKIAALTQYYKYQSYFIFSINPHISEIMGQFEQNLKKIQRKMVKKIMDEPPSISSYSEWSEGKNSNLLSSFHLEQIDSNRSSVFLRDVCDKITYDLHDVKPLYFYQGSYPDEVAKFKEFIFRAKQNKNKIQSRPISNDLKIKKLPLPLRKITANYRQLPVKLSVNNTRLLKRIQKVPTNENNNTENKGDGQEKDKPNVSKKLRGTFNNLVNTLNRYGAKSLNRRNISKTHRNNTVTIKGQSFSKTSANETVSKQQNYEGGLKRKNNKSIRIRKCKTANKALNSYFKPEASNIEETKKFPKQVKERSVYGQRNLSKQKSGILNTNLSSSKGFLNKNQNHFSREGLVRQKSRTKGKFLQQKETKKIQKKDRQNVIQNLIKEKLKLRA